MRKSGRKESGGGGHLFFSLVFRNIKCLPSVVTPRELTRYWIIRKPALSIWVRRRRRGEEKKRGGQRK